MKVAVLGASGRTGIEVLASATARGDAATAVVRSPQRFADGWARRNRLSAAGGPGDAHPSGAPVVLQADARDPEALGRAFAGQDAVAFCLGADRGGPETVHQEAMSACLAAMDVAGVKRVVAVSASGMVVEGDDPVSRYLAKPLVGRILAGNFADLLAMEAQLAHSSTAWTVVRPPRLTDGVGRGHYQQRHDGNVRWGFTIRRADLALAITDALHDDSTVECYVSVAR
jgi:putative NADH-flavin reductase